MNLLLPLLGIALFLVLKRTIYTADTGKTLWVSILEMPVDVCLLGFMIGMTSIAQVEQPLRYSSETIICAIILMNLSVLFWKVSCRYIVDTGAGLAVSSWKKLTVLTSINVVIMVVALILPVKFLGASL